MKGLVRAAHDDDCHHNLDDFINDQYMHSMPIAFACSVIMVSSGSLSRSGDGESVMASKSKDEDEIRLEKLGKRLLAMPHKPHVAKKAVKNPAKKEAKK